MFAGSQSIERRGSGRSRESGAVILWLGVSGFLLKVLAALLAARPPERRTAGSSARRDGVLRLRRSSRATPYGSAVRTLARRHKESPSFGRSLSAESLHALDRG